jgi:hypothetical protein
MHLKELATLAVMAGILMAPTSAAAQSPASSEKSTDGWQTIIYPIHGWLPVFGADVALPDFPGFPGSAKTSGNFNGAVLAGVRVERARLSIEGEFLWAGMSGSVEAPRFDLTLNTIAFRILGGVEAAPALYIDGGVRRLALDMTASILGFQPVNWKPGLWEPVVGVTYRPMLSRNVRLFTQADLGFSTDNSSRSGEATASIEWKPISHLSLGAGWGWMYVRADGTILTRPVHLSQTLNGPILTLGIPF